MKTRSEIEKQSHAFWPSPIPFDDESISMIVRGKLWISSAWHKEELRKAFELGAKWATESLTRDESRMVISLDGTDQWVELINVKKE